MVVILNKTNNQVKERLIKYLRKDETNLRKTVLQMFLVGEIYTTNDIYNNLVQQGFDLNYRGVSAMVGLMNTRLGILRVDVTREHNHYSLKDDFKVVVQTVLDNF
jgi:arginine repressor